MKIDYLNISYRDVDLADIVKDIFSSHIVDDPRWNFRFVNGVPGLTLIKLYNINQIQLSSEYFERPKAYEEAKKLYTYLKNKTKTRIARIDVCHDFESVDIEELVKKKYIQKKYFPRTRSIKTSLIETDKIETVYFSTRHFKIRIYDRIKSAQNLIAKGKARKKHIDELREYAEMGLIRCEFELRGNYTNYCDRIWLECSEEELCKQVVNSFLTEIPFVNENGSEQKLWKILKHNNLKKIPTKEQPQLKNKQEKEADLKKTASFLANKAKKWGINEMEMVEFLLESFGLHQLEFSLDNEETMSEKILRLAQYEAMFGPLQRRTGAA